MLSADPSGILVRAVTADEADTSNGLAANAFVKRIAVFPGVLVDYAGLLLPSGYLWCDGSAVSRTAYATLFAAITAAFLGTTTSGSATISSVSVDLTSVVKAGMPLSGTGIPAGAKVSSVTSNTIIMTAQATANGSAVACTIAPWGVGNGTTTFNVPDMRGRVAAGTDNMGGTSASRITAASGVAGTTLGTTTGAETHVLTVAQMPSHTHVFNSLATSAAGSNNRNPAVGGGLSDTTLPQGGDGAHNNVQPTAMCNKIIKT